MNGSTADPPAAAAALAGRHAVVTGGGRGIGAAVAGALAGAGAAVSLLGRDAGRLEARAAKLARAAAWVCDVTDEQAVAGTLARAAEHFGEVAVLVNNAGAAESAPLGRTDTALWRRMLEVNLSGAFFCTRAVLPGMIEAGFGRIVNVASTAGLRGYPYVSAYCAAKHGLVGLTRSLALEVAVRGVTVNAVCPGYTETDLLRGAITDIARRSGRSEAQARQALLSASPRGRPVQPDEIAATVLWLCLPGAESVTGQAIAVAGGEVV